MATRPTGEVIIAEADYQRGGLFKEIDHDRIANAIRYLSFARLYYPNKYHEFLKVVALHHATWSMEDSNFITALYEFERGFMEFLGSHPTVEQEVNRLSPKQMVDRVDTEEIANAKERRDAARKMAQRAVANAIKRGTQVPREKEIEEMVRSAAIEAETPVQLQQFIKDRIPIAAPVVDQVVQEDPWIMQKLLLSDPESTRGILDQTVFSPLPNKRALHTILTHLPMDPNETRERFLSRAQSVAQTAMVLSSDLSKTPLPHVAPSGFIEAMLSVQKDRRAIGSLAAFNKLITEQTKNAVSLVVVAKAWEDTVDVITKRAGGALAPALEKVIQQGSAQFGSGAGQSLGRAGEPINEIVGLLLRPTMGAYADALLLNQSLPPGQKLFSDKNSVATFIQSLDATRQAEGAASAALFLTVTTHYPGAQFVEQRSDSPLAPVVTVVRFAKDSVAWKIVDRAAKSEAVGGFFGKILGFFGIRLGAKAAAGAAAGKAAGAAAGAGIRALLGRLGGAALGGVIGNIPGLIIGFIGGALVEPVLKKGWQLAVNFLSLNFGAVGEAKRAFEGWFSARQRADAVKKEGEISWLIGIFVCGAILFPVVWNIGDQISFQSGQITSFESSALAAGGPYTEIFPAYNGPFPSGPTLVTTCAVDHKNLTQKPFDSGGIGTHKNTCAYDFNAQWMSPVVAAHDGCVAFVRTDIKNNKKDTDTYGNVVILAGKNQDGSVFYSRYAHLAQNTSSHLSKEQCITAGTPIGNVDNTGNSTGTHLHLEFLNENMGYLTPQQCSAAFSIQGCTQ